MGAHILESNSSGNLTPAVSEAGGALPGYLAVMLPVLMVTLVVVVVAGNALVIMAFVVDKTLRTQSNYFFLNLAISDFLVAIHGDTAALREAARAPRQNNEELPRAKRKKRVLHLHAGNKDPRRWLR
ncbi:histamine H3 receptor-like, partial [Solea senegalensis]